MLRKGAVTLAFHKITSTSNARAYRPLITSEDCILSHIAAVEEAGVSIDIPTLVKRLMKKTGSEKVVAQILIFSPYHAY